MAARDRYTRNIECTNCGAKGLLHISENDYPFMKRLDREVDKVIGEFVANMQGDRDIRITCQLCGQSAVV